MATFQARLVSGQGHLLGVATLAPFYDLATTSVGLSGTPKRPTLRTFIWAWFEFPQLVSQPTPSVPTRQQRRNPVALAQEWQQRLQSGEAASRTELARQLGITSAHVTQVLSLLLLSPEARDATMSLGDPISGNGLGIRALRSLLSLPAERQVSRVEASKAGG